MLCGQGQVRAASACVVGTRVTRTCADVCNAEGLDGSPVILPGSCTIFFLNTQSASGLIPNAQVATVEWKAVIERYPRALREIRVCRQ